MDAFYNHLVSLKIPESSMHVKHIYLPQIICTENIKTTKMKQGTEKGITNKYFRKVECLCDVFDQLVTN